MTTQRSRDVTQIAQDILEAFNSGDWARIKAPLAANLIYEETGTQRRIQDADAYVQLCQGWKQAFPDAKATIRNMVSTGDTVVQEVLWEGTQDGDLPTPAGILPGSGRRIMVPATIWLTFQADQVREIHHHIDMMGMMQQLGVMSSSSSS